MKSTFLFILAGLALAAPARSQSLTLTDRTGALMAPAQPEASATLASLVEQLDRNNPELKASRREIDMRVARVAPASAPPDPMVSFGSMNGIGRTFLSPNAPGAYPLQFGASQEIPYPGKLALKGRVASSEVDQTRWNYEDVRRRLIADLKLAYFDYVLTERSLAIVQRNKVVLDQFRQIAEAQLSVGKGLQQDVLKAQVEISLLLERITMLERDRGAMQARINGLLYREPATSIDPDLTFGTAPLPPLDVLRAQVAERYPALKRDERGIDRGQQALQLANKELLPDFAVNATSWRQASGMPWLLGVDFSVKVPIYWQRKQRPMIAEAAAALDVAKRTRENTLAMGSAQLTEEYLGAESSRRLMDLYSGSVLPQARLALESSQASYQVGKADFLTLLTNFMTVLTYEVNLEEQTARYRQGLARIEPFIAEDLIR
jgi:outer membrane protein TolC